MSSSRDRNMGGFTLMEMAIVIVLMGLMVGGTVVTIGAQQVRQKARDAERDLDEIKDALIGYAASRPGSVSFLPCPSAADTGVETARNGAGDCPQSEGRLPWVTLGLGEVDPWGGRYRYRVTPAFSNDTAGFDLTSAGDIEVCSAETCLPGEQLAVQAPAVVISHGENRLGAFLTGGVVASPSSDAGEAENSDDDARFVSGAVADRFDDIVMWLSPHVLKQRMIQVGRLP